MIYCEGKYCSRKEQCAYHEVFETSHPRQYLDCSTNGTCLAGFDQDGKYHEPTTWYWCGDHAASYHRYKGLGWREGKEYINSKGAICDEVCLTCEHQGLCFKVLEYAGMIIQPGDRVRFDCEKIKENPEHYKEMLRKNGWKEIK